MRDWGIIPNEVNAIGDADILSLWVVEKKKPTGKTFGRDFILGAILVVLLLQVVPDSTTSLLSGLLAIIPMTSGSIMDVTVPAVDEIEVRIGVPRF